MRLAILTFVLSLFTCVFAVNLEDKSNIEDITAAFNLLIDGKKYPELGKVLSPDVTYDPGNGPVQGLPAAIDTLSKIIPSTTTTYFTLGTQLIKFLPPFDKDKRSNLAESVSYSTFVSFGSGNLTGESFILFVRFVDKEIVRTRQPGFGGWRFKNRKFELVVSYPYQTLVPHIIESSPSPFLFQRVWTVSWSLAIFRENLSETPPFWDYRRAIDRHIC